MTLTVYTLLFTLKERDPAANKYVTMFSIWYSFLRRNGGLGTGDTVVVMVDSETIPYLQKNLLCNHVLHEHKPFKLEFVVVPPPATLSEGIAARYSLLPGDLVIYLDIDVLCVKGIRGLLPAIIETPSFFASPEGTIENFDYGGYTVEVRPDHVGRFPGFSGGLFAYTPCRQIAQTLQVIRQDTLSKATDPFYTIDQPFLNREVYNRLLGLIPSSYNVIVLKGVRNNWFVLEDSDVVINYCGEPGNEELHYEKMLTMVCLEFLRSSPRQP